MGNCDSCSSKGSCKSNEGCLKVFPKYGEIKNIIGVISGKGGVGKSTVSVMIAIKLAKKGYKVGIMDADITGPSIPRILNINDKRAEIYNMGKDEVKFVPVKTKSGIKVISLNLLTEEEEQPVIWRGPLITGVLSQMYTDSQWDELDYLVVDMPPGTGDVALTVMQSMPIKGMVIVSTPQDMVSMIVKKVVNMCKKLNTNLIGVVQNMSYIKCAKCGEKINLFSKKNAKAQSEYLGIPLIAELPFEPEQSDYMADGSFEEHIINNSEYDKLIENIK